MTKLSHWNPINSFLFFIGAAALGMFFLHPAFLAVSFLLSSVCCVTVLGRRAFRLVGSLMILVLAITIMNPFFNNLGNTVLFTYLGSRRYSLEALYYGLAAGVLFFSVLAWFTCYNRVMTGDKFLYLFGSLIPAASLLLTMILRMVPRFQKKTVTIATARHCVGKSVRGDVRQKTENAAALFSALMGWALEGGVETADAMRSRGYGLPGRTNYAVYRFRKRDAGLFLGMLLLIALTVFCTAKGAASITYLPEVAVPAPTTYTALGIMSYSVFLSIPSILHIAEEIQWHILRSKI